MAFVSVDDTCRKEGTIDYLSGRLVQLEQHIRNLTKSEVPSGSPAPSVPVEPLQCEEQEEVIAEEHMPKGPQAGQVGA